VLVCAHPCAHTVSGRTFGTSAHRCSGKRSPPTALPTGKSLPLGACESAPSRVAARFWACGTVVAAAVAKPVHLRTQDATTMESILGIHETALTFRAHRMEVLAANLANADTPHYKARDVEFSSVLAGSTAGAATLRTTDARHLSTAPRPAQNELKYRIPHQPSLDGNTVEADLELARYAENAVSYQASLLFASNRISTLRTALSGTRS
jgi:flagellar basal-body rod protein FlgB